MQTYALTLDQMATIVNHFLRISGYQLDDDTIIARLTKVMSQTQTPIALKEVSSADFDVPCRYFPAKNILGFTTGKDEIAGVFVKED